MISTDYITSWLAVLVMELGLLVAKRRPDIYAGGPAVEPRDVALFSSPGSDAMTSEDGKSKGRRWLVMM